MFKKDNAKNNKPPLASVILAFNHTNCFKQFCKCIEVWDSKSSFPLNATGHTKCASSDRDQAKGLSVLVLSAADLCDKTREELTKEEERKGGEKELVFFLPVAEKYDE